MAYDIGTAEAVSETSAHGPGDESIISGFPDRVTLLCERASAAIDGAPVDAVTIKIGDADFLAVLSMDGKHGWIDDDPYLVKVSGIKPPDLLTDPSGDHNQMWDRVSRAMRDRNPDVATDTGASGRKIVLVAASDIQPRKVYWLWKPRIPRGALTLLAGMPGAGKSQVSLDYAAKVTRGESELQDGQPRCVLIYATEDAREHVIVPRLIATGADLEYVQFVTVTDDDNHGVTSGASLVLPIDQRLLVEAIEMTNALLVIFDPLMSVMDPKKSVNQDRELRTALEPLAAALEQTGCAGLGLAHFRKAGGAAADRVMGGRAFVGVARSVLVAVENPDEDEMILSLEKSNYGSLGTPGLRYRIATRSVKVLADSGSWEDQPTPYIEWLGETTGDGNDHVRDLMESTSDTVTVTARAGEWLIVHLRRAGGTAWFSDIREAAEAVDISVQSLQRARTRTGVVSVRASEASARTYWHLDGATGAPPADTKEE